MATEKQSCQNIRRFLRRVWTYIKARLAWYQTSDLLLLCPAMVSLEQAESDLTTSNPRQWLCTGFCPIYTNCAHPSSEGFPQRNGTPPADTGPPDEARVPAAKLQLKPTWDGVQDRSHFVGAAAVKPLKGGS